MIENLTDFQYLISFFKAEMKNDHAVKRSFSP